MDRVMDLVQDALDAIVATDAAQDITDDANDDTYPMGPMLRGETPHSKGKSLTLKGNPLL